MFAVDGDSSTDGFLFCKNYFLKVFICFSLKLLDKNFIKNIKTFFLLSQK